MNFKDLTIFKAIYEEQTINKAAKKLGYAQSNLTARLRAIEEECQTSLFIRNYHGVTPTAHGEKFYAFVLATLSKFDSLKNEFAQEAPKLLTSELLLKYLVVDNQLFPIDSIKIICKKTSSINSELNQKPYDFVVTFQKLNRPEFHLTATQQLTVRFLGNNRKKTNELPIVINSDQSCPLRKLTLKLMKETKRLIEIDSLETILQLVAKGQAIALLPTHLEKEGYLPIDNEIFSISYYSYKYKR